jgi:hypothetical protein
MWKGRINMGPKEIGRKLESSGSGKETAVTLFFSFILGNKVI